MAEIWPRPPAPPAASPSTQWSNVYANALSSPDNAKRNREVALRNRKLTALTPEGTRLNATAQAWLARHQEKAQTKLEKRHASRLVQLRHLPKPPGAESASGAVTARPESLAMRVPHARMPPLAERGTEPQVLAFDLDVLAERVRESLFEKAVSTAARPGLVEAGLRLRERFLLCALSRAPAPEANELLSSLMDRGLAFDYAFALPPPAHLGRTLASPVLDADSMAMLRSEMGFTAASMSKRLLAILSLELDEEEIDARLPSSPTARKLSPHAPCWREPKEDAESTTDGRSSSMSSSSGDDAATAAAALHEPLSVLGSLDGRQRPHVRMWLPGVTSVLVPHARLQEAQSTVRATLIADLILNVHKASTRDWSAAHAAQPVNATAAVAAISPGRRKPSSLLDTTSLGGLHRLAFSDDQLARCGLGESSSRAQAASVPPLGDPTPAASAASLFPSGPSESTIAFDAGPEDEEGGSSESTETRLFVLCVNRMHRRRQQRTAALSVISGRRGTAGDSASSSGRSSPVDPLLVEPFEIWATCRAATPPGAPKPLAGVPPSKSNRGRRGSGSSTSTNAKVDVKAGRRSPRMWDLREI